MLGGLGVSFQQMSSGCVSAAAATYREPCNLLLRFKALGNFFCIFINAVIPQQRIHSSQHRMYISSGVALA